jgi:hypothetical protein
MVQSEVRAPAEELREVRDGTRQQPNLRRVPTAQSL